MADECENKRKKSGESSAAEYGSMRRWTLVLEQLRNPREETTFMKVTTGQTVFR